MTTLRNLVPIEQLTPLLESLLNANHRVARELSILTGYCEPAIRVRLEFLESEQRAHRVPRGTMGRNKGGYYVWCVGPMPALSKIPKAAAQKGVYQRTVHEYEIHTRRDEMVSALFGQPVRKKEAGVQEASATC